MNTSGLQPSSIANSFHERYASFFEALGLVLVNDPNTVTGPFAYSRATYETESGLCLSLNFDYLDGNSLSIKFGRLWTAKDGWRKLSGPLRSTAALLGFELPPYYRLGYENEGEGNFELIFGDLQRTLPRIIEHVSLENLISVEKLKFGAEWSAKSKFGESFREKVSIQDVSLKC